MSAHKMAMLRCNQAACASSHFDPQGHAARTMIEIDDNEIQFASIPRVDSHCITDSPRDADGVSPSLIPRLRAPYEPR